MHLIERGKRRIAHVCAALGGSSLVGAGVAIELGSPTIGTALLAVGGRLLVAANANFPKTPSQGGEIFPTGSYPSVSE